MHGQIWGNFFFSPLSLNVNIIPWDSLIRLPSEYISVCNDFVAANSKHYKGNRFVSAGLDKLCDAVFSL